MSTPTPTTTGQTTPPSTIADDPTLDAVMTRDVVTIPVEARLSTALRLMATTGVRHLPVLERGWCQGVLEEIDLVHNLARPGCADRAVVLTVGDVQRPAAQLPPTARVSDAVRLMARSGADAVLVTEGGRLLGIVTATDLVRLLAHGGAYVPGDPPADDHPRERVN